MQTLRVISGLVFLGPFLFAGACGGNASSGQGGSTSASTSSSQGAGGAMNGSGGSMGGAGGSTSSSGGSTSSSGGGSMGEACPADGSENAYYLSPNGDDNAAGTNAAPWGTFTYALKSLKAGDTLCVRGGTYAERVQIGAAPAGTADAPIKVLSVAGERPIIEGLLWIKGANHWSFHGINVTWSAVNAHDEHMVKFTDGSNWEFADAEVWGAESFAGILVAGAPTAWALRRLYVHDTANLDVTGHSINQDHLIYVNAGTGGGVIERSILVGSPNGRAVKVGPPSCGAGATANVVIRYNTMVDNTGPSNIQFSCESYDNLAEWNLMVRPLMNRANITGFSLTGANNVGKNNLGWESNGVVDTNAGVVDGGGNITRDPLFVDAANRDFHVNDAEASKYGAYAP